MGAAAFFYLAWVVPPLPKGKRDVFSVEFVVLGVL